MSINERMIGQMVIVRTESAGVWFGEISQKEGREVIIANARRMYQWWAEKSISLSGVALYGTKHDDSKICAPVKEVWLEAIELIPCSDTARTSLMLAPEVEAE